MIKIEDKIRRTYYTDLDFFQFWMVSTQKFYAEDNVNLLELSSLEWYDYEDLRKTFKRINYFFDNVGIKKSHLHKYTNVVITVEKEEEIKKDYPTDKTVLASYRKIQKWSFTIDDILNTYGYISSYSDKVYFAFDYTKDELEKINTYINKYIDEFINHELIAKNTSVLIFDKQKEWFIKTFKSMQAIEKFGNNFIVTKKDYSEEEVLFFHTLYALEKLDYIEVINIWFSLSDWVKTYQANIIVNEIFIKEINQEFKKANPKKYIEHFDSTTGMLTFAGKKIELSKSGKETDPVLLMKTLIKKEDGEWVHNDEIFEDWGIRENEQVSKNKIYFALQKINTTMGLSAQIEDFIEWWTKKARINPKYRKVVE